LLLFLGRLVAQGVPSFLLLPNYLIFAQFQSLFSLSWSHFASLEHIWNAHLLSLFEIVIRLLRPEGLIHILLWGCEEVILLIPVLFRQHLRLEIVAGDVGILWQMWLALLLWVAC
jgi:hypothetical protein